MSAVRVTDLKNELRHHLRKVQAGQTITVLHRNTPIARIIPYKEAEPLLVRHTLPETPSLAQILLPPPLKRRRDIVALLLEERQGKR